MKRVMSGLILLGALLGPALPAPAAPLRVVTTTEDLKSVAEFIGGDKVRVESLGRGSQNYHFLAAKPSYMVKAKRADLFILVGLDLEVGYAPLILDGARNPAIREGREGYVDASVGIEPLDVPTTVDRSMGDIHAHGNPHYWLDPLNMKVVAATIAERLSELSPGSRAVFMANSMEFQKAVDSKMKEWAAALAPYEGEKIITYHKTWNYFAKRFGLEIIGELEPKPGVPPSPAHLAKVVDMVNQQNVKVILNENIYPADAADYVAGRTGAVVVNAPISVGGTRAATDYFLLIDAIVRDIQRGFEQ